MPAYQAKRDFTITREPSGGAPRGRKRAAALSFVVQKHAARRLHWDFRLEHGGVLWSWAVPKGPSIDPADKRLAVKVEDHPLEYGGFEGTIPAGQYGAGTVEIWDKGTWQPAGDAAKDLAGGELKFTLAGERLRGGFVLVRLKPRPREKGENWLLIKEHDAAERPGIGAAELEQAPRPKAGKPPIPGAVKGSVPNDQRPQLATAVDVPPDGPDWLHEIKFDGYRLLLFKHGPQVRLMTRNGHDWTSRFPALAKAAGQLTDHDVVLDGELIAQREDGVSSFALLQQALSEQRTAGLIYYAFDLLQYDGWDLRPCRLADRKGLLQGVSDWGGWIRYSDHHQGQGAAMRRQACAMGLEGVIAKQQDAPYRAERGRTWLKLKCQGREEFIVLGWTPPAGSRTGLGALHMGYRDNKGALHYAGGVGTGFTEKELAALRKRLNDLRAPPPEAMLYAGDPLDRSIQWVRPELVAEVQYGAWSGAGRLRHAVYLGLREDKAAADVVRSVADPAVKRQRWGRTVTTARKPVAGALRLTHPERELWPGITKQALADYWDTVADTALPGIANRPLALVRCPDGIDGERFFQKHRSPGFPGAIEAGEADGAPYLFIRDRDGLRALAQMSAIELHAWGASLDDPLHPDRMVFDLDPGDDVPFAQVVRAALDIRRDLDGIGLQSFCRTTGGKGLHVVVPIVPDADWDGVRAFCKALAETLVKREPNRFVATVSKARRRGRILIDWLRNGLGSTAVASYSPRARPGATVATPLAWREVTEDLDPSLFTLETIPTRLRKQRGDPWPGFGTLSQHLPDLTERKR